MSADDLWTQFLNMIRTDVQQIDDPDELLAMAQVIVHTLAPEPEHQGDEQ